MVVWFEIKSPLTIEQRNWIDARFQWLLDEFGEERLRRAIVTPSAEFFPDPYSATESGACVLLDRLCGYMDIDRSRIDLNLYESEHADDVAAAFSPHTRQSYALGAYEKEGERIKLWLEKSRLAEPQSVVATLAHELGHIHLLGDRRCDESEPDHEPLTDLLTVFFGLGIFNANEALREVTWRAGNWSGWSSAKQGYLTMAEYAYALARYAHARHEIKPVWIRYLRADVKALLKLELKHLVGGTVPPSPAQSELANCNVDSNEVDAGINESKFVDQVDELDKNPICNVHENSQGESHYPEDEFFTLGTMHLTNGEFEQAVEAFSRALQFNSTDAEAWLSRAEAHVALKQFTKALEDSTQSIQLDPMNKPARVCRATANLWLRRFAEALQDTSIARKLDKHDSVIHMLSGLANFNLKNYHEAKRDLDLSIQCAPTWTDYYLCRSEIYKVLGKNKEAESDIAEAIRRDSKLSEPSNRDACLAAWPLFLE